MKTRTPSPALPWRTAGSLTLLALAAGCGGSDKTTIGSGDYAVNVKPAFVVGTPATATYDGSSDDLLTAGLGRAGLASAVP